MSTVYGGRYSRLLRWDEEPAAGEWVATIPEWPRVGQGRGWEPADALLALEDHRVEAIGALEGELPPSPHTYDLDVRVAGECATDQDRAAMLALLSQVVHRAADAAIMGGVAIEDVARIVGDCAPAILRAIRERRLPLADRAS